MEASCDHTFLILVRITQSRTSCSNITVCRFPRLGGIQAISGQKKNGKSFVLTQLMAAVLGIDSERVKVMLPGLKVPERTVEHLGHLPRVLYVDTEMEKLNSAKVLRRVHWLCEWDMKQPNERFSVLWLRTVKMMMR